MNAIALLAVLSSSPSFAEDPNGLEARAAELDARADELDAQALELEQMFEALRAQREAAALFQEEALELREELIATQVSEELTSQVEFGERIAIGEDAVVEAHEEVEEVVSLGGNVDVYGHVRGDATSFGGTVHVYEGGRVEGNAIAIGGRVLVDEGAEVGGRVPLTTTGELNLDIGDKAAPKRRVGVFAGMLYKIYSHIIFMLSFAGVGVLTVGLFPDRIARIARAIQERPVRVAFLGGFVNLMLTAATFFMAITIIGLPIAGILAMFLALAWLFGFVGLCQAIGDRLPFEHKPHGRWLAFLVGVVVITFVSALGPLGLMSVFAASVVGMGAAFQTRLGGT